MQLPMAQIWFFRDIQRAFSKGADTDVIINILTKFVLIALPLIFVFVVIRYRDKVEFFIRRAINMKQHAAIRLRIAQHLKNRRLVLEIYVQKSNTQQFVGRGTVAKIGLKRMSIGFVSEVPNALSRVISGKRVICYCRPFKVGGASVNSFHSYMIKTKPGVSGIKYAIMYTPAEYIHTVRRSTSRKRPGKPGTVKVRLWGAAKKDKFMVLVPDFETDDREVSAETWKAGARVVNISAGGLKLELHPKSGQGQPKVNEHVVLEVMILDPSKKSFTPFVFTGAVRNISRPKSGAVYLGIQFLAIGERTGSRAVTWQAVRDEVPELKAILG